MRILGIDPGLATLGYGVIDTQGSKISLITAGAATTAVNYVTLKLVRNQEGYTFASFRKSFALYFKQ